MNMRNTAICLLYSKSDKAIADKLQSALKYYDINVWNLQNISLGNKIVTETEKAIKQAKFIIVLWSSNSIQSAQITDLASEARNANKILIPVLIENVKLPHEFVGIQYANLVGWNGNSDDEPIVQLKKILKNQGVPPKKRLSFNYFIGISTLILTLVAIGVTVTIPEIRKFLKLEKNPPTDVSTQPNTSTLSQIPSSLPSITASPSEIVLSSPSLSPSSSLSPSPSPSPSDSPSIASSSPSTSPIVNDSQKTPVKSGAAQEFEGFIFEPKKCNRQNKGIKCEFLITNKDRDRTLILFEKSRIVLSNGDEIIPKFFKIGSQEAESRLGYDDFAKSIIPQEVPIKGSLVSPEISVETNKVSLVELSISVEKEKDNFIEGKIKFHNITLSGS